MREIQVYSRTPKIDVQIGTKLAFSITPAENEELITQLLAATPYASTFVQEFWRMRMKPVLHMWSHYGRSEAGPVIDGYFATISVSTQRTHVFYTTAVHAYSQDAKEDAENFWGEGLSYSTIQTDQLSYAEAEGRVRQAPPKAEKTLTYVDEKDITHITDLESFKKLLQERGILEVKKS